MNDAIITEENIQKAMVVADNGGYAILLTLTPAGQHQLNADAKDMLNKRLAIIINETLVSAPLLRSTVFGPRSRSPAISPRRRPRRSPRT